ncbi:MAG TPA: DUF4037 domain-containing protein [Streptosporangiaceae bacterium]|nr:DUF4037 domain-containing protein [Streptosporangiaceae bacterium]
MAATFIPGLELARLYYTEVVRPLLDKECPGLAHSAALIGPGSEVLGLDSPRSTDHNWGPRLQIFLADDATDQARRVSDLLAARLPAEFRGYPTSFPASTDAGFWPRSHWVTVAGLRSWLTGALGFDPLAEVSLLDWLSVPTQVLAEITGGTVFHDGLAGNGGSPSAGGNGLSTARTALAWYPHDIWLYVLACQWQRVGQEEAFPGRCAEAGDDLGSALVTARLARDLVRLVLLMQRRYPPYSKWLGSAFARTAAAAELTPLLTAAVTAATWPERERHLSAACEAAGRLHNAIAVTPPLDPAVRPTYYDRPYRVMEAGRFARVLREHISDERLRALPLIGAVDQFVDSTDAIGNMAVLRSAVAAELAGA